MQEQRKEYARKAAAFKARVFRCEFPGCNRIGTEVHHVHGRLKELLLLSDLWKLLCHDHHTWVHANPKKSREMGFLAPLGQWNSIPR